MISSSTIWKHTPLDAILVAFGVGQLAVTLALASGAWTPPAAPLVGFAVIVALTTYNIIVVSHVFTHQPWFRSVVPNGIVSMMNSFNIAQSVQRYELYHVRNHHRYNNDRMGADGTTKDVTSTYRGGRGDDHAGLLRYTVGGAVESFWGTGRALASVTRGWKVSEHERELRGLLAGSPARRARELRQVRLDRAAQTIGLVALALLSWRWTLLVHLPAVFTAFVLVNVQNYYEHVGGTAGDRYADSVSHYGRLYNRLTFNDGFHQEHHLRPRTHWRRLPALTTEHGAELAAAPRTVSPVPAIVGFLDRGRPRRAAAGVGGG